MATPQGYDFDFIDQLPDDCMCKICHLALRQPVQTKCCGHRFCKDCLVEATKRKSECPIDRKPLNIQQDVFDDKGAERTVKSLLITCPRQSGGCEWQGELADGKVHDQKCDFLIIPCAFQRSGCSFKTEKKNMEEHLKNKIKDHLVLTSEKLSFLQEENAFLFGDLSLLHEENEKLKTTLADIVSNRNKFIWKIINFPEHFKKAKETGQSHFMYSDPLYTDRYGYKMRVKLYHNGHRDVTAGHVSIFIHILRSEYDAVLPWPFARKITITLLDQKEIVLQRKNVEKTITYKEIVDYPECFKRPTTDSNPGYGYPKFISHENLMTENYIVGGTIFVQVEVREEYNGAE